MRGMRRQDVWIGGRSLRDLDARIISVSVDEPDNEIEETYGQIPGHGGQRLLERKRIGKTIAVEFAVRELYDLAARDEVLDTVNAWAAGAGYISTTTRPGKRIFAPCKMYAAANKIREYTAAFRLEFRADESPWWEDASPSRLTLSGAEAEGALVMRGSWPGRIEASITPTGGTLTELTLTVTGADGATRFITLEDVSVATNTTITMGYDAHGYFAINAGNTSILDKRTALSSDELTASTGAATVSLTANVAVSAEISGRGRWL